MMRPDHHSGVQKGLAVGFTLYFWTVVLFLLLPLLIVIPVSFGEDQWLQFPPRTLSLKWYRNYFSDPGFVGATLTSLWIAALVAFIATVLGIVTALGLSRLASRWTNVFYGVLIAPMIIPIIIFALALFILLNELGMTGSVLGLILAHTILALPFPVLIVSASLQQFDVTLERAGRILGANPLKVFLHITLPHLAPAAFASAIFSFFVSFDELVIALFITGRWDTLPKRIWSDLRLEIDPTIAAVASVLIAMTLVGITAGELLRRWAMSRAAS
jgi:putative spermidine/putrescine transport system permease protein